MDHAYDTLSLAEAYEAQGYHREALEICVRMSGTSPDRNPEILAACRRLETILAQAAAVTEHPRPGPLEKRPVAALVEQWLTLLLIRHRKTALDTLALKMNEHGMKR